MSSSTESVSAPSIFAFSSSVISLRSSSEPTMDSRRLSSSSSCSSRSRIAVIWTSSSSPVFSFRYRAMNGTVAPSSISTAVAATWRGCNFNSWVILTMCFSSMFWMKPGIMRGLGTESTAGWNFEVCPRIFQARSQYPGPLAPRYLSAAKAADGRDGTPCRPPNEHDSRSVLVISSCVKVEPIVSAPSPFPIRVPYSPSHSIP